MLVAMALALLMQYTIKYGLWFSLIKKQFCFVYLTMVH